MEHLAIEQAAALLRQGVDSIRKLIRSGRARTSSISEKIALTRRTDPRKPTADR